MEFRRKTLKRKRNEKRKLEKEIKSKNEEWKMKNEM